MRRVCAVVEAAGVPGRNPLLPALRDELAGHGVDLVAWDPTGGLDLAAPGVPGADLYLLKGDHPLCLAAAALLEDLGAPCLNGAGATIAAADKARALLRAAAAGIPVPSTRLVADEEGLAACLADGTRVVKPLRGAHGSGVAVLGPGAAATAGPGPWLVQERVAGDGLDRKVYGVGGRAAVRLARFVPGRVDADRAPVGAPNPGLVRLAVTAGADAGLTCWGADFVVGPDGPVLVDLNAFPGYRTVAEAPAWIAEAVLDALEGRVVGTLEAAG